jgi:hypothetical protein
MRERQTGQLYGFVGTKGLSLDFKPKLPTANRRDLALYAEKTA